jgi:hypothetical protein
MKRLLPHTAGLFKFSEGSRDGNRAIDLHPGIPERVIHCYLVERHSIN